MYALRVSLKRSMRAPKRRCARRAVRRAQRRQYQPVPATIATAITAAASRMSMTGQRIR